MGPFIAGSQGNEFETNRLPTIPGAPFYQHTYLGTVAPLNAVCGTWKLAITLEGSPAPAASSDMTPTNKILFTAIRHPL